MIPLLSTVVAHYARVWPRETLTLWTPSSHRQQAWGILLWSGFLVSVPVFIQAPLVRSFPWLTLLLTIGWVGLAMGLKKSPKTVIWGDLCLGFSWSWLAGAIYWGWFRWEPFVHLPIEAIGLPFALWGVRQRWGLVGHFFYLGSLLGTAITDSYFYLTGLIPYWRQVMAVEPDLVASIFQSAIAQIQNQVGVSWAIVLVSLLLGLGTWALQKNESHWWAFAGAVLSTILVDSVFWLAALLAH